MEKEKKINPPKDSIKDIELPKDIQKRMLEFFMQTSIPRKKANNMKSLSDKTEKGDYY
ncbi:MAG: hypothetical protein FWD71_00045 [Oscillospiraceae bacterium]|nr:hypothetical protein [Oscillospiraceae bacterium]